MFGRESLRDLIRSFGEESRLRHVEFMRLQERREEESREEFRRRDEEFREFNREILLRNEKVYTAMIAEMEKNGRQIEENTERTRAGTQAILKLLDRFDERGGAAA